MNFKDEINKILEDYKTEEIRPEVWDKYGKSLFGSDVKFAFQLRAYQVAFLKLLNIKYEEIIEPLIISKVKSEFDDWYEEPDSYKTIFINSIDVKSIDNGEWQIMYEDENIDLIVHLYMKEWEFDYTARTS